MKKLLVIVILLFAVIPAKAKNLKLVIFGNGSNDFYKILLDDRTTNHYFNQVNFEGDVLNIWHIPGPDKYKYIWTKYLDKSDAILVMHKGKKLKELEKIVKFNFNFKGIVSLRTEDNDGSQQLASELGWEYFEIKNRHEIYEIFRKIINKNRGIGRINPLAEEFDYEDNFNFYDF